MKAIVHARYGPPDVLQFRDTGIPVPADNQVLIRVCAASVNPLDWHIMRGEPFPLRLFFGLRQPKHTVLGCDIAGRVEAVGSQVTRFHLGDAVFGGAGVGGFAEYACVKEEKLALKPVNLSFEQAAAVPVAAITALQALRDKGKIRPGLKVLVDGASGGVGTFGVQIAKSFGAEVTAVCSTRNVEKARTIGADHVIDYTREDFTRNGQQYDLILGANAYHSIFDYRRALSNGGIFVKAGGDASLKAMLAGLFLEPVLSLLGNKKTCGLLAHISHQDLVILKELIESGKVTPVIDRSYPLGETQEAIRYLEQGHAQGKVVLSIDLA